MTCLSNLLSDVDTGGWCSFSYSIFYADWTDYFPKITVFLCKWRFSCKILIQNSFYEITALLRFKTQKKEIEQGFKKKFQWRRKKEKWKLFPCRNYTIL